MPEGNGQILVDGSADCEWFGSPAIQLRRVYYTHGSGVESSKIQQANIGSNGTIKWLDIESVELNEEEYNEITTHIS